MGHWKRAAILFIVAILCGVVGFIGYFSAVKILAWIAFGLCLIGLAGAVLAIVDQVDLDKGLSAPDADQGKTGFVDPNEIPPEQKDAPADTGDPRRGGESQEQP